MSSEYERKRKGAGREKERACKHWGGGGGLSAEVSDGRGDSGENVYSKVKITMTKFISREKILSSLVNVLNVVVQ